MIQTESPPPSETYPPTTTTPPPTTSTTTTTTTTTTPPPTDPTCINCHTADTGYNFAPLFGVVLGGVLIGSAILRKFKVSEGR